MTGRIPIAEIVAGLDARAEGLCAELLPLGRREGTEWVEASRAHGGLGDSLKVCLKGSRRGVWAHFAGGDKAKGDLLDLVAYVRFGGNKRDAIAWAADWLGYSSGPVPESKPRPDTEALRLKREAEARDDIERRRRNAIAIFRDGVERLRDTPVDRYLKGRGVDLARLGRQPRCLRFHDRLRHPQLKVYAPAMVACITRGQDIVAVHRTFLMEERGAWVKIRGEYRYYDGELRAADAKLTLGRYVGGAVRLWRGGDGKPWGQATGAVSLTEGIEDGLTVALAMPEARVAAAVSLANMRNVELPPGITEVVLVADNDGDNAAAARALDAAARAQAKAGRTVRIARAPDGTKDMNALLTGAA